MLISSITAFFEIPTNYYFQVDGFEIKAALSQVGLLLMTIEKQLPEFHSDYGVFVKSKGTTLTRGEESFQLYVMLFTYF